MSDSYRFGIEEEYFLADAATRGTPRRGVKAFHAAVRSRLDPVERELLASQVEVATPPSTDFGEARSLLSGLRADLAAIAREHGLLVFAAGTHPVARWSRQSQTEAERYDGIMRDLRMIGARNMACGLHVHVEVSRPEARVDLMGRLMPFLPLLLALSTSSPFWQGRATGLAGYRLAVFGELPRSGLPDLFDGAADYERFVRIMVAADAFKDASFLWWVLRPSVRYPTLELRVADSCTDVGHTCTIAALYRCLVRLVERRPDLNSGLTGASRAIAAENIWRAQRDGARATLVDEASESGVPIAAHLDSLLALVAEDAAALGCTAQVAAARSILAKGTSADHQRAVFKAARQRGLATRPALNEVVDWLAGASAGQADGGRGPSRSAGQP